MADQDDFKSAVLKHKGGLFEQAEADYRDLLKRVPNHSAIQRNLTLLLVQTNREEEAWIFAKAAYAAFKDDVQFLKAFSQSAIAVKRTDRAISALERAVNVDPDDLDLRRFVARLCISKQEFSRAIPQLLCVIAKANHPNAADHKLLAEAYWSLEQTEDTATHYSAAVSLNEDDVESRLKLIRCLERLGHLEEFERHIDIVISQQQDHQEALFWQSVLLFTRKKADEALTLLKSISPDSLQDSLSVRYWFERGRAADKIKDSSEAMQSFDNGNALWNERHAPLLQHKSQFTDVVKAESLALNKTGRGSDATVTSSNPDHPRLGFLVGIPRSGTTLLDQLLSSHTDICVLEEKPNIEHVYQHFMTLEQHGRVPNSEVYDSLRSMYWESVLQDEPEITASLVIDKFPLILVYIRLIALLWPDAPILFATRHPCDVCLSNYMQDYRFNPAMAHFSTLGETVNTFSLVMEFWEQAKQALGLSALTIKYEDFVTEPEPVARRLLTYLEMDWQNNVLLTHETAKERGRIETPSYRQVTEPINTSAIDRWTRYQTWLEPYFDSLRPMADLNGYVIEAAD